MNNTPMLILGILNVALIVTLIMITFRKQGDHRSVADPSTSLSEQDCYQAYIKNKHLRRDDKALYYLQEFIWLAMAHEQSVKNYDILKLEHEAKFIALGAKFPSYPY
jgi:hypothetical protein